jgi:DNA-binding response OmpR family regulator
VTRILLLEDDRTAREAIVEKLARQGLAVEASDSIETFRALVAAGPARLALMDRHVRGVDALEDAAGLAASGVPVIMMSSDAGPDAVRAVLARGVSRFLAKPFSFATLVAMVEEALHDRS